MIQRFIWGTLALACGAVAFALFSDGRIFGAAVAAVAGCAIYVFVLPYAGTSAPIRR